MPVYNGSPFLERSINSVIKQSYTDWELILIDDNSKDNSIEIIDKFLEHKKIKLFRNQINMGIAATRNVGISNSSGEFIALLDQDDEWLPSKLEKQVRFFSGLGNQFGLVYTNTKVVLKNGKTVERKREIQPGKTIEENLKKLVLSNFISSLTVLIRKESIDQVGLFDENIKWGGDDYDLWLRLATKYKFGFINEVLAIRHEHGGNFSAPKKKIMKNSVLLIESFVHDKPSLKKYLKKNKAKQFYSFGIKSIKADHLTTGLFYIIKSFFYDKLAFQLFINTIKNKFINN